ncbi:MAG: formylglycine-generating enzyme family protein [Chloroflexi bacterium]|nr:formylglycine-generating enzyme family protein [Chloroflexota bacterium]
MKFEIGKLISVPIEGLSAVDKKLQMVWINSGTFSMGDAGNEKEQNDGHDKPFTVILSQGFWLGKYPVTRTQWQAVMNEYPDQSRSCPNCPVGNVDWYQALSFCQELNKLFTKALPPGYKFSLPTEAQWEYACKAGMYSTHTNIDELSEIAWHGGNSGGSIHPVGEKKPNAWGLYDMQGNISEWCFDFPAYYPVEPAIDWVGKGDNTLRCLRGMPWSASPDNSGFHCSSGRNYTEPDLQTPYVGFRLALTALDLVVN